MCSAELKTLTQERAFLISKLPKVSNLVDENILEEQKKLILLVDLDETIVCSSEYNQYRETSQNDVHTFKFRDDGNPLFVKFRPHVREFLAEVSKYFVLCVWSFGSYPYARKILRILDADKQLFGNRIVTREQFKKLNDKTKILEKAFPFGFDKVFAIDDRVDVWKGFKNLIRVQPYTYYVSDCKFLYARRKSKLDNDSYLLFLMDDLKELHEMYFKNEGSVDIYEIAEITERLSNLFNY